MDENESVAITINEKNIVSHLLALNRMLWLVGWFNHIS
jgi:hypothetical protein